MCQALSLELGTQDDEGKQIFGQAWIILLSLARHLSYSDSQLNSFSVYVGHPFRVPFPQHTSLGQ